MELDVMPLGLRPGPDMNAYVATLFHNHDFALDIDVLALDHTPIRSLVGVASGLLTDGQINLQRDSAVERTATFTFYDPDHSLHLDADSPWQGATYGDRMIQVRHSVWVPVLGRRVESIPFVGPVTKVSRDGDTVNVECQDKACLALTGTSPVKAGKGMNAVAAIRRIMAQGAGENRFRFPSGLSRNIQKPGGYSTGWAEDSSPWLVAQRIAAQINMQLFYSCDGYLTLRRRPTVAALAVTGAQVTSDPQVDWDASAIFNMVRVTGTQAPPKHKTTAKSSKPQLERPATKISAVAVAAPTHPLSPQRLGRSGVVRYIPQIIDGAVYKSVAQARDLATTTLQRALLMTTGVSFDMVPVFHLDTGDVLDVQTDAGHLTVVLEEGSIPLGVGGDMSVGQQRAISEGRGIRIKAGKSRPPATKAERRQYKKDMKSWRADHKKKAGH